MKKIKAVVLAYLELRLSSLDGESNYSDEKIALYDAKSAIQHMNSNEVIKGFFLVRKDYHRKVRDYILRYNKAGLKFFDKGLYKTQSNLAYKCLKLIENNEKTTSKETPDAPVE